MIVRDRVADELPGEEGHAALDLAGLGAAGESDPQDLSGGERQRLTLALAMAGRTGGALPALVCLDEPTRGMDAARSRASATGSPVWPRRARRCLSRRTTSSLRHASPTGSAARRGRAARRRAAGPGHATGGWYFATEVARVLDGAAVTPEAGIELLGHVAPRPRGCRWERIMSWQVASFLPTRDRPRGGVRVVRADSAELACGRPGRGARGARRGRAAGAGAGSERRRRPGDRAPDRLLGGARGSRSVPGGADLEHLAQPGARGRFGKWPAGASPGLAEARLATVFGRHVGRLGLACACAAMAFAYGALLDLSVMVTYGGEQSAAVTSRFRRAAYRSTSPTHLRNTSLYWPVRRWSR